MRLLDKTKQLWNTEKGNAKRNFLKLILAAPFWILLAAVILLSFGIGRAVFLIGSRPDYQVARLWQGKSETCYRHMCVYARGVRAEGEKSPLTYLLGGQSIHRGDISQIREKLQSAADTGLGSASKNKNKSDTLRGWEDCYSTTVMATVTELELDDKLIVQGAYTDAQLVAVGGNYQAFHPYRYMSGGFLPETPVDKFHIVINDVLAWKFYHSYDVIGRYISINGQMFTIIGVVEEKDTKVAQLAGEPEPRAFIYFAALDTLYGSSDMVPSGGSGSGSTGDSDLDLGEDDFDFSGLDSFDGATDPVPSSAGDYSGSTDFAIQCYEALIPELVRGVGVTDVKNALPSYSIQDPEVYVVNKTDRYKINRVVDTMFPLGETTEERLGYEFPYWETAAQLTEERLFFDYLLVALGILLLLVGGIMIALKLRARKAVAPDELVVLNVEEIEGPDDETLMLKA